MTTQEQKNPTKKVYVSFTFDYDGMSDYYSGHGHAFAKDNLVCCYRIQTPITYLERTKEIVENILSDLNSGDYQDIVSEELYKQYETEIQGLSDKAFEDAIRENFKSTTKDNDLFFNDPYTPEERKELEEDEYSEGPVIMGYFHITIEEV